jgi:glycerate kinase
MSLNVLIAPDKFKGTLTAAAAAQAIARGWKKIHPQDNLELLPMTDGGDGFGGVMSGLIRARVRTINTVDAAHRHCRAPWWWESKTKTAVIESANVIGLAQLPAKKFHPFELDTFGLGPVLQAAAKQGAQNCWVGIGGSATNDGGFGLALELGWKFFNRHGKPITQWTELDELATVRPPKKTRLFRELIVAVDVQNPLLGPRGCTRIYGPQKGLQPEDFAHAEKCLRRLATVLAKSAKANEPGAGAAGGLGFGLRAFLGARFEPGFEMFAQQARLDQHLQSVDLVITGEGSIDPSTLMGKGVGQLARLCHRRKIPCLGLAGVVAVGRKQNYFKQLRALTELADADTAKKRAAFWLERLARRTASQWPAAS